MLSPEEKRNNRDMRKAYENWLAEKVMIECWTTNRCARELSIDGSSVERDFESIITRGIFPVRS